MQCNGCSARCATLGASSRELMAGSTCLQAWPIILPVLRTLMLAMLLLLLLLEMLCLEHLLLSLLLLLVLRRLRPGTYTQPSIMGTTSTISSSRIRSISSREDCFKLSDTCGSCCR